MSDDALPAIMRALQALLDIQLDPEGRVQQSQTDALRTHGLTAQIGEIMGIQRDQILALVDALAILVGRFVEHDRKVAEQHRAMLDLLHSLASAVGQSAIAAAAEQARQLLHAAEEERLAELARAADQALTLLSVARTDAKSVIGRAVNRAEHEIAVAADMAREELAHEREEIA